VPVARPRESVIANAKQKGNRERCDGRTEGDLLSLVDAWKSIYHSEAPASLIKALEPLGKMDLLATEAFCLARTL
jgi:hypothetical protein